MVLPTKLIDLRITLNIVRSFGLFIPFTGRIDTAKERWTIKYIESVKDIFNSQPRIKGPYSLRRCRGYRMLRGGCQNSD